ncbi:hypothetical protein [Sphingomonas sp. STIS6.2]|uniref:hypothetical protein n=1 Tax=Sphingomonas sp. STIS6.2 TaxID=1379700 RepID=UPI00131E1AD3|nr:hypothetical protein [Sphingomonas sp. STIS6.2]
MMIGVSNDNEGLCPVVGSEPPDAHGQAAMLLVESLIHSLIDRSVLNVTQAIDVVTVAMDVKAEIAAGLGDSDDTRDTSLALLSSIRMSLNTDSAA